MTTDQKQPPQPTPADQQEQQPQPYPPQRSQADAIDGLKDKKPEDLTAEELRLMADTMPGEGPGD